MAFSENDTQLHIWGRHFGVPLPSDPDLLPVYRLRYWSVTNRRASVFAETHPDRCLLLRFEDLCDDPVSVARRVAEFCRLPSERLDAVELTRIVQTPPTLGRHDGHDISRFADEDLEPLSTFGYGSGRSA